MVGRGECSIKCADINAKTKAKMTPLKEQNNFPITIFKEKDIYGRLDEEFKIIVLKEAQQPVIVQIKKMRKSSHEQNKKFNKKIERKIFLKNQTELNSGAEEQNDWGEVSWRVSTEDLIKQRGKKPKNLKIINFK